jgi:hypothetical protein
VRSLAWRLGLLAGGSRADAGITARAWFDELRLGPVVADAFRALGADEAAAWAEVELLRVLLTLPRAGTIGAAARGRTARLLRAWLADPDVRPFIRVNVWEGVAWFAKEAFERLAGWMVVLDAADAVASGADDAAVGRALVTSESLADELIRAGEAAGYRVDRLEAGSMPERRRPAPAEGSRPSGGSRAMDRRQPRNVEAGDG